MFFLFYVPSLCRAHRILVLAHPPLLLYIHLTLGYYNHNNQRLSTVIKL